jgi:heme oxygenase (biliverdin-IX-beta and delta-forming)
VLPVPAPTPAPVVIRSELLRALRSSTAVPHQRVEESLGLTNPALSVQRLRAVVVRLGAFFGAAQAGLEEWAQTCQPEAAALQWPLRRRLGRFGADAAVLGATATEVRLPAPVLPAVAGTAQALGRLYVLEGSSLGGRMINQAFAQRAAGDPLAGVWLSGLDPYGDATGAMWHGLRRFTTAWASSDQRRDEVVQAAVSTFAALDAWCEPLRVPS